MATSVKYNKDKYKTKFEIPKDVEEPLQVLYNDAEIRHIEADPMGNDTILSYYPNALIISYDKLKNYNYIEDLLPEKDSYCFLLYTSSVNSGHWTLLSRMDDEVEYFDPYGLNPDAPLRWISRDKRRELGEDTPFLSLMLDATDKDVVYNPFDYQSKREEVATCGRHCCFRLKTIINHSMDLNEYYKMMRQLKTTYQLTYDDIVSENIDRL